MDTYLAFQSMASWSVTRHLSSLLAHSIIATSSATWSYTRSLFVGRQEGTQSWATSARRCGGRWRERGGGTADLRKASRATARRHWRRHPTATTTTSSAREPRRPCRTRGRARKPPAAAAPFGRSDGVRC